MEAKPDQERLDAARAGDRAALVRWFCAHTGLNAAFARDHSAFRFGIGGSRLAADLHQTALSALGARGVRLEIPDARCARTRQTGARVQLLAA